MQVWDMDEKVSRSWPQPDQWQVSWYTLPPKPSTMSEESWQIELESYGHDWAKQHHRSYGSLSKALRFARSACSAPNLLGPMTVQRKTAVIVHGDVMAWEDAGEPRFIE